MAKQTIFRYNLVHHHFGLKEGWFDPQALSDNKRKIIMFPTHLMSRQSPEEMLFGPVVVGGKFHDGDKGEFIG